MFICLFCGDENPSDRAQVCRECGSKWMPSDVDHPEELKKYYQATKDFYFDPDLDSQTHESLAIKLRQRFKISHVAHTKIFDNFSKRPQFSLLWPANAFAETQKLRSSEMASRIFINIIKRTTIHLQEQIEAYH